MCKKQLFAWFLFHIKSMAENAKCTNEKVSTKRKKKGSKMYKNTNIAVRRL